MAQIRTIHGPTAGEIRRRLLRAMLLLVGVAILGTVGYVVVEGWTLIEAAYMTAITLRP